MPPADPSTVGRLNASAYVLSIRQQPERAKIATGGKEKDRKAIDPPPMVQLRVKDPQDPAQNYLQSPYYFVACNLWDATEDKPAGKDDTIADTPLVGSLVSSLHRLKDTDNQDGGFFVFGDVSVKIEGTFRLKFTLFEILAGQVVSLNTIISKDFTVYSSKNFPGMAESTFISRSFGDQGVRIRIRKENRKRPASRENNEATTYNGQRQEPIHQMGYGQNAYGQQARDYRYEDPNKRQRSSIGHAGQLYEQPRQDWSFTQAQSGTPTYPTHSTSATYHGSTASVGDFSFKPHQPDTSSIQPTFNGQGYESRYPDNSRYQDSNQIAQPTAVSRHNPAEHLQYGDMSYTGEQRDVKYSYQSPESGYKAPATLPPLLTNGQTSGPYTYSGYGTSTPTATRGYPAPTYTPQALTHASYPQ